VHRATARAHAAARQPASGAHAPHSESRRLRATPIAAASVTCVCRRARERGPPARGRPAKAPGLLLRTDRRPRPPQAHAAARGAHACKQRARRHRGKPARGTSARGRRSMRQITKSNPARGATRRRGTRPGSATLAVGPFNGQRAGHGWRRRQSQRQPRPYTRLSRALTHGRSPPRPPAALAPQDVTSRVPRPRANAARPARGAPECCMYICYSSFVVCLCMHGVLGPHLQHEVSLCQRTQRRQRRAHRRCGCAATRRHRPSERRAQPPLRRAAAREPPLDSLVRGKGWGVPYGAQAQVTEI
jgi:hypothetical protein